MLCIFAVNLQNTISTVTPCNERYDLLSTLPSLPFNFPIEDRDITSTYLGTESMSINLPTECKLNENSELSFRMLKGKTILSPANIGFWTQIYHDEIPDSEIIFQDESTDYSEILQDSVLPFFTTNLTSLDSQWGNDLPNNRSARPLSDEVAHQKFYACKTKLVLYL